MKWAASMILSLIRWFTAAVLLLIPDFLTYSVVCADNGVGPVKEMIFDRLGYTFTLISPIAFAFFALSCFLFKRKKSVSEKRADFVTAAAIAVFSAAVFLCVSGGAPSPALRFNLERRGAISSVSTPTSNFYFSCAGWWLLPGVRASPPRRHPLFFFDTGLWLLPGIWAWSPARRAAGSRKSDH